MLPHRAASDQVRFQNRRFLLSLVRRHGALSRTALADRSGLSSATVSAITSELLTEGWLAHASDSMIAAAAAAPSRGRPQMPLRLNPERVAVQAVYLAVDGVTVALVDYGGEVREVVSLPALDPATSADALLAALLEGLRGQRQRLAAAPPVDRTAVAVQGVVDRDGKQVLWSPILAPTPIALGDGLSRRLGMKVLLRNDANAMADALDGGNAAQAGGEFAALFVGYGVGMGVVSDAGVLRRADHSAFEFGHVNHEPYGAPCRCGGRGCIEAYAADYAIWRAAHDGVDPASTADPGAAAIAGLAEAARSGEPRARAAFLAAGRALGFGLGRLFALLAPMPVVLTGTGARNFDLIRPGLAAGLEAALVPALAGTLDVRVAEDSRRLALDGAALAALRDVDEQAATGSASLSELV
ncbi:MAG: ROK family transcriptional regulator [Pseudomonadota bacterium]